MLGRLNILSLNLDFSSLLVGYIKKAGLATVLNCTWAHVNGGNFIILAALYNALCELLFITLFRVGEDIFTVQV